MSSNEHWNNIKRDRRKRTAQLLLLVIAAIVAVLASLRIETVTIEGSTHYTAAQFEHLLFPSIIDRNTLLFFFRENTGGSIEVPFVDRYTVQIQSLSEAHVIVYEKQIVGYVDQYGTYMYFDQEGKVTESTSGEVEDVPRVIGLGGEGVRLRVGDTLPVEDDSILKVLLSVSQFLQTRDVEWGGETRRLVSLIDRIYVDRKGNVTCILGDLQIYLGGSADMEEKLLLMSDILPKLTARRGTVYLDNYSDSVENPSYVFRENVLMLTPGEYDQEVFETEAETAPPETTAAPERTTAAADTAPAEETAAEMPAVQLPEETAETAAGAGEDGEQTAAAQQPETEAAETAAQAGADEEDWIDGNEVDDIPEDYVGGDGYEQ